MVAAARGLAGQPPPRLLDAMLDSLGELLSGGAAVDDRAAEARRSLLAFAARLYEGYQIAAHHRLIAEHLEAAERGDIDRLVITMPPRHGKSLLASTLFPAWYLGRNPDRRIITCSYAARLANEFSRATRRLIRDNPAWPWPDVRTAEDSSAVDSWDIAGRRGGLIAAGVGGGITGRGGNCILIDDYIKNAEEADSEVYRDKVWEWYTSTAYTRLEKNGVLILIATRWHEDDLIGRALNSPDDWTLLNLPAMAEDDLDAIGREPGEALWPEKYGATALDRIRKAVGPRTWISLYQQRPAPAEGGMFKRGWWQDYSGVAALPKLRRVEQLVDSSFKDGVGNDWSVIATWGTDGLGSYYLIDLWRDRVEYPDLIRAIHDQHRKWRHLAPTVPVVIEDKASGQSAIQTLRRPLATEGGTLPRLPVVPFILPTGSTKISRADAVSPVVESRSCYLPVDAEFRDEFITEHAAFPTGKHDDQVDTTSMALSRLATPAREIERIHDEVAEAVGNWRGI